MTCGWRDAHTLISRRTGQCPSRNLGNKKSCRAEGQLLESHPNHPLLSFSALASTSWSENSSSVHSSLRSRLNEPLYLKCLAHGKHSLTVVIIPVSPWNVSEETRRITPCGWFSSSQPVGPQLSITGSHFYSQLFCVSFLSPSPSIHPSLTFSSTLGTCVPSFLGSSFYIAYAHLSLVSSLIRLALWLPTHQGSGSCGW